jgi:ribonuclease P protein subunit POP4
MTAPRDSIAVSLLSRAHSPDSATRIFTEKIKTRPLHLKPSEHDNAQHHRQVARQRKLAARKKKLRPKALSSREKRALCLYDIPKEAQKYKIYEPLHEMWVAYVQELLGDNCMPVTSTTAAKLCSADYHGAELEVVRSRCVSRVGVKGFVVKDSKFAFEIVTTSDQLKLLPKEHTIFKFTIPRPVSQMEEKAEGDQIDEKDLVFELHGDQFIYRAVDRANRKFKSHFHPDL